MLGSVRGGSPGGAGDGCPLHQPKALPRPTRASPGRGAGQPPQCLAGGGCCCLPIVVFRDGCSAARTGPLRPLEAGPSWCCVRLSCRGTSPPLPAPQKPLLPVRGLSRVPGQGVAGSVSQGRPRPRSCGPRSLRCRLHVRPLLCPQGASVPPQPRPSRDGTPSASPSATEGSPPLLPAGQGLATPPPWPGQALSSYQRRSDLRRGLPPPPESLVGGGCVGLGWPLPGSMCLGPSLFVPESTSHGTHFTPRHTGPQLPHPANGTVYKWPAFRDLHPLTQLLLNLFIKAGKSREFSVEVGGGPFPGWKPGEWSVPLGLRDGDRPPGWS